jgi:hypothetical protein
MTPEDEQHFREFEQQGESAVRLNIAAKRYGEPDSWKNRKAEEWIRRIDENKKRDSDQQIAEINSRIAIATELSAKSAKKSACYAKLSSWISAFALLVSVAAFLFN